MQGHEVWDHWEAPFEDVSLIYKHWARQLIASDAVEALHKRYLFESIPTSSLPPIPNVWTSQPPKSKDQYDYIAASDLRPRSLNMGDPGSGKSWMSLERARQFAWSRCLIVTLRQLLAPDQWPREVSFGYPDTEQLIYIGDKREREKLITQVHANKFVMTSYEVFDELNPEDFDCYILDEAHLWHNKDSQRYQNVERLINASWRKPGIPWQILTGTPIGNSFVTMWTLLHSISPLTTGSFEAYRQEHEEVVKMSSRVIIKENADGTTSARKVHYVAQSRLKNPESFKEKLAATSHRISIDDIVTYKRVSKIIDIPMSEAQHEYYENCRLGLLDGLTTSRLGLKSARVQLVRLRQIAEGLFNLPEEEHNLESGKLDYILAQIVRLRAMPGKPKLAVWSPFQQITELLHMLFPNESVLWNGNVDRETKEMGAIAFNGARNPQIVQQYWDRVNKYNGSRAVKSGKKAPWVYAPGDAQFIFGVIDLRSSVGVNFQSCRYQIFSSFSLSVIANIQTAFRIIRADQTQDTLTEVLTARNTWERSGYTYLLNKWKDSKLILDGQESVLKNDMLQLLEYLGAGRRQARWIAPD